MPNIKVTQLPQALPLTGNEPMLVLQNAQTRQTPVNRTMVLANYAAVPAVAPAGTLIFAWGGQVGAQPLYSDGVTWRLMSNDQAIAVGETSPPPVPAVTIRIRT